MPKFIDMTGERFGRLTVSALSGRDSRNRAMWGCVCNCGNSKSVRIDHLREGRIRSCGCLRVSHGHNTRSRKSPTYSSWDHMIRRCSNPNTAHYHHYGGRGITVCDDWLDFENFLADMGERPTGTSIDRRRVSHES